MRTHKKQKKKYLQRFAFMAGFLGGLYYWQTAGNSMQHSIGAEEQNQVVTVVSNGAVNDGAMSVEYKSRFVETDDGDLYYFDAHGNKKTGYFKVNNNYYFGKKNGKLVVEDWKYVSVGGKKYKLYFDDQGKQKQDVSDELGEQSSYRLAVNIKKNMIVVYAKDGNRRYTIPVKAMVCSCGVAGHSTIIGNYSYLRKTGKWHTLYYGTYGKYCTRISGPYLFHSVVYAKNGDSYSLKAEEYKKLGSLASHGCVRLSVKDAKWIYDRAGKCTAALYRKSETMPLKKPKAEEPVVVGNGKVYDPTDSDVN